MPDIVKLLLSSTISSRDIALATGKSHKNVLRDIDKMIFELDIQSAQIGADYKDSRGRTYKMYILDKRLSLILASGYSIKLRSAIIDRWIALELSLVEGEFLKKQLETERLENMIDTANLFRRW